MDSVRVHPKYNELCGAKTPLQRRFNEQCLSEVCPESPVEDVPLLELL
jgi:hypothetical protein